MQLTDNLYWYALGSYEAGEKVKGWGVYAGIRYAFGGKKAVKQVKSKQISQPYTVQPIQKGSTPVNKTKPVAKSAQRTVVQPAANPAKNDYSFMEEMERRWREGK